MGRKHRTDVRTPYEFVYDNVLDSFMKKFFPGVRDEFALEKDEFANFLETLTGQDSSEETTANDVVIGKELDVVATRKRNNTSWKRTQRRENRKRRNTIR